MLILTSESLNKIRDEEFAATLLKGGLSSIEKIVPIEYEEADFEIGDFSLLDSSGKPLDDEDASNILYKKIQFPSTALSTDERVWATLALGPHFGYSSARWSRGFDSGSGEDVHRYVQNHFFCPTSRVRYRSNALSRLWWKRRYIDKALTTDRQKASHLFFSEGFSDWSVQLLERPNLAAIPAVANAIVDSSYERFVEGGRNYDRSAFRGMLTKLDIVAGSTVPTLLSYEDVREVIDRTYRLVVESPDSEEID